MNRMATLVWRFTVVLAIATLVPIALYGTEILRRVDADTMLDASVYIRTVSHVHIDEFGDSVWSTATGSGFLVSREPCEAWTNHHVVEEAAIIEVFPRGWSKAQGIPARVVNASPHHDVAILSLERCDGIGAVVLGRSHDVRPGDETYAVGNPLGRNPDSISRGIISHTERYIDGTIPYLQTDAAISPGNSGGALFDHRGRVIGMNTAVAANRQGINIGVGYAVPIDLVRATVDELRKGPPSWGDAGLENLLSPLTVDEAAVFGVPGGRAAVSVAKSPASGPSAGKLFARDVIYRIGQHDVDDVAAVYRAIAAHHPGASVQFHLVRAGADQTVSVELANGWHRVEPPPPEYYDGYLGMSLEMWREDSGGRRTYQHPVITRVQSLGPAHRSLITSSQHAGMMRGPFMVTFQLDVKMVSGAVYRGRYHPIDEPLQLHRLAEQAYASGDPLLLEIQVWHREDPSDLDSPLEHQGTAFYKIHPEVTAATAPSPADDLLAAGSLTRS